MASEFDAYHKWLGIPPEEQPPNHYRLLGIRLFETDPDVVESASDQRMAHLRSFQAGRNGVLSQKLLNEVAAAKSCLLQPGERAEYDAELKRKLTSSKTASKPLVRATPLPRPVVAVGPAAAALPSIVVPRPTQTLAKATRQAAPTWMIATIGAVAGCLLLLVAVVVVANLGSSNSEARKTSPVEIAAAKPVASPSTPAPLPPPSIAAVPKDVQPSEPVPESFVPPVAVAPAPDSSPVTASEAPFPAPTPAPAATLPQRPETSSADGNEPPAAAPDLPLIAPAVGLTTELLPLIHTKQHQLRGEWLFDGRELFVAKGRDSLLQPPFIPPAEYDLHVTINPQPRSGQPEGAVMIGVVVSATLVQLGFDMQDQGNLVSGIARLDDKLVWDQNVGQRGRMLVPGQNNRLTIRVRRERLQVEREGSVIVDWQVDLSRYAQVDETKPAAAPRLSLLAQHPGVRFVRLAITPAGGSDAAATAKGEPAAGTRPAIPSETEQAAVRQKLAEVYSAAPKRTAADKLKLANELSRLARESQDRQAERYVLLRETQRFAAEAGQPRLAIETTELLCAEYDVDTAAELLKVVGALSGAAKDDAAVAAVLEESLPRAQQATAAQQFDTAQRMLEGLVRLTQRPAGRKFAPQLAELRAANAEAAKLTRRLDASRDKLRTDPDDAEANQVVGTWLCLSSGNWVAGLPHLAKGTDQAIKACASRELSAPPQSTDEQVALADMWWEAGQAAAKEQRTALLSRAADWYRQAQLGTASGLVKAKIDKRLADLSAVQAVASGEKIASTTARGAKGVYLAMQNEQERVIARAACQRFGLAWEEAKGFDFRRADYSQFSTILCGSNDMDYWDREEARDPAAFQHIERFVNEGGHLIVLGCFAGRNTENLNRFGIYATGGGSETFKSAGPGTDALFQGILDLVPKNGKMHTFGLIRCAVPHDVLLRIGPGPLEDEPAFITVKHKAGRVSFSECEPHANNDWWLITVTLSWIARGSPVQ